MVRATERGDAVTAELTAPAPPTPTGQPVDAPAPASGRAWRTTAWAFVPLHVAGVLTWVLLRDRLGMAPSAALLVAEIGFGLFTAVGALIVSRRPRNPVGWLLVAAGTMVAWAPAGEAYAAWVLRTAGRPDALALVGAWVQSWYWLLLVSSLFVLLPLLFPDGRLPSPRWRPVLVVWSVSTASTVVAAAVTDTLVSPEYGYRIDNPIGVDGLAHIEGNAVYSSVSLVVAVATLAAVLASLVRRFRRSRGDERQQVKWFLYGAAPLVLLPISELLPPVIGTVLFTWVLVVLPVSIGVAVLRYRLDGIDVVINRTLVYVLLTAGVLGVYVLVVGYLGTVLRRDDDDLLVSLLATGIVAVLFAPARDRLQRSVDRLLYGRVSEPYAALAQLGERLESTLEPAAVLPAIVSTVRDALRLPYVAIRLAEDAPPVSSGEPVPRVEDVPLLHQGLPVGTLVLGLRPGEHGFSPADRRLLADLARQAGVAVSTVRLTADLQRSRERLVTAREEERRRLRRDLHDGLGAQLAGLTVQTGVLRGLIDRDPVAAGELAGELRAELRAAIADIRRLVHGLRPPALDELGLVGALQRLAGSCGADGGLRVDVDVPGELPALPAAVEVAAYRIVQEALTNVVRHAGARTGRVLLAADAHGLTVEVTDDGVGLPGGLVPGVGLSSMRERAAETGGSCEVAARPGGGTRVLARLPLAGGS
jgi:signal transduction histidine kinase